MMRVRSQRPSSIHMALFFAVYVLGCGYAQALAIVPGTGISMWPPGGLFIAVLLLTTRQSWPWWILSGCLGELFSNFLWFGTPLAAAMLICVGNSLAAAAGAWLLSRSGRQRMRLETLPEVLTFVVCGAGIAPLISATVGSTTVAWFGIQSQDFAAAWPLWWIGDATGVLVAGPLVLILFQNWRHNAELSVERWPEICGLALIFLGLASLSLSGYLPFAYIIMPPLLWAAARFELRGAAVAIFLLVLMTLAFTISGTSPFAEGLGSPKHKQIMLQLFLAISAFSALIVAAISRQHQIALLTLRQNMDALRERERELSQLVDMVPSLVWRLTPDGEPIFFNKQMVDFLGLDVSDLDQPGMSRLVAMTTGSIHPDDAAEFGDALRDCLATGERLAMRLRLRCADGVYHWMSSRADPLRGQDGRILQWYGVSVDIDDAVAAQEALGERERELSQLVDMVPVHIRRLTTEGEPTFFNKRLIDFFGLDVSDLGKPGLSRLAAAMTLVHPDDAARLMSTVRHSVATGEPYSMKYRMRRADGAYRWVDGRAEPIRDAGGMILQWFAISIDVDDEMTAQESLRDRERELLQLVDMVPSLIWRLSPNGDPVFFNKQMVDFLGMTVADTDRPGMSPLQAFVESVHPDDASQFGQALNRSLVTGASFAMQYRLRRVDGSYRWMSGRAEPMRDDSGCIVQWFGLGHDIDDQMRLFSEIEEREARIRRLVDSDVIGIVIWDLDGRLIDANNAFLRMLQYDREDLKAGLRWLDMTPPEWQEVHARDEAEELKSTGKMQAREKEYFRKDGSRVPVLIGAACFEGRSTQGVAYILDLTELKRAEAALRDRERELAQLVDTVPTQIWATTPDGKPSYMNKRLTDYVGLTLSDLDKSASGRLQAAVERSVYPDDEPAVRRALEQSFSTGETFVMRYRHWRADGVYRWVDCRAEPLRDEDGRIVKWYGVTIDIDDEVRAQEELRRTQGKLAASSQAASLAELSASIAHEVNQPLAAIVANSHACYRWLTADPPNLDRAKITSERIIRDANSAADVVSRIRALFRQAVEPRTRTPLSSIIVEARELMAEEATRRRVHIEIDVESDLPLVAIDRVQIQQVLVNLMRNSMEAMELVEGDRPLDVRVRRLGDQVLTEVSDRGPGVEFPEKIFNPFFTTKEQGMGMGLAICRSIVESHGGRLSTTKNLPHGAVFSFTLPIDERATLS